ncbi:MAG: pyruvate kinase [Nitrospinota bacterium]|nr:pyruvate kinase [Nitrospinota bacterium]
MKKTKIVCTIGPASASPKVLRQMIQEGMDVARLNFSHGTIEEKIKTIRKIRSISSRLNKYVGILVDLGGPKFRLGKVEKGTCLVKGKTVVLSKDTSIGNATQLTLNRQELISQLKVRDRVMISDGQLQLKVIEAGSTAVKCRVIIGGDLKDGAGLNMPDTKIDIPSMTRKDRADLKVCIKEKVDFIGLSFVRSAEDIELCRKIIKKEKTDIFIIAKMEKAEAIEKYKEIIQAADGVMVARGDLGIEVELAKVPLIQKKIINYANRSGKPVITATEMLLSMVHSHRPTRAETSDVANAIIDGSDAIMLSEETSIGENPSLVVKMMARIAETTEKNFEEIDKKKTSENKSKTLAFAVASSTVELAKDIGASLIISPTDSGDTPRRIVKYRPNQPVIALSTSERALQKCSLSWGVVPWKIVNRMPIEKVLPSVRSRILKEKIADKNEQVILCAGYPFGSKENKGRIIQVEII